MLSLHPDKKLFRVKTIDPHTFILDTDCKWPAGVSPESGFVSKLRFGTDDCNYLFLHNEREATPSHLEINAMRRYYKEHRKNPIAMPLLKIEIIN